MICLGGGREIISVIISIIIMKKKLVALSGLGLGLAPFVALAQTTGGFSRCTGGTISTLSGMICKVNELINTVIPLIIALGVLYFVFGVVSYVIGADEEAKKKGRDRIIYGIIGLAVIVGVWGLVGILNRTFGVPTTGQNITYPTTPY
jgi:hypothetical protein